MRVTIESSGGFAGRDVVVAQYDTADLPPGEAKRIREAVDELAAAEARGGTSEIGADIPSYRITVEDPDDPGAAGSRTYELRGDPSADAKAPLATLLEVSGS
ncbi:protealysin inhibitor emfourin [Actinomadura fibrosa]|uniref:Protealysin inhibitor emfourin n=1 Tax=Actinomadura fibrosa TaxID=111802 RepID=A0ABW2XGK0_9ACTN|nr:protealysin inhibitor emfourin [Actinomadura fibrosa]